MSDDLIEAFERLEWCNTELENLKNAIDQFSESRPYKTTSAPLFAETTGFWSIRFAEVEELPIDIAQRSGTTLNEIRSILDSLACTLAKRNGATSLGDVSFPVANSKETYETDPRIQRKLRKISLADRKIIKSLEPWAGGSDLLHALHAADNTRKHEKRIELSVGMPDVQILEGYAHNVIFRDRPFRKGGVIARFSPQTKIIIDIKELVPCYSEPPFLVGKEVVGTLRDFSGFVYETLELFN